MSVSCVLQRSFFYTFFVVLSKVLFLHRFRYCHTKLCRVQSIVMKTVTKILLEPGVQRVVKWVRLPLDPCQTSHTEWSQDPTTELKATAGSFIDSLESFLLSFLKNFLRSLQVILGPTRKVGQLHALQKDEEYKNLS